MDFAPDSLTNNEFGWKRRRAAQEQHTTSRALATDKQSLEIRSHVLSLRESELESRLLDRERRHAVLEGQRRDLTTLLKKEQAFSKRNRPPATHKPNGSSPLRLTSLR